MAGMEQANAAQAPSTDDLAERSAAIEKVFARTEGEFVNGVRYKVVTNVKDARPFVAGQTIHICWSIRLTSADRSIIDGVGPCIARLEREALCEAPLQRHSQCVLAAAPNVRFDAKWAKGFSSW